MIDIGPDTLLDDVPVELSVDGGHYVLYEREDGTAVLYAGVCPHQRGRVKAYDDGTLRCPNHQWEFDPETGDCLTVSGESLAGVTVDVDQGRLYVPESD